LQSKSDAEGSSENQQEDIADVEVREKKVSEMHFLTKVSKDECVFYLESTNWEVSAAVKNYYEFLR
jgi:hypothetical protein